MAMASGQMGEDTENRILSKNEKTRKSLEVVYFKPSAFRRTL